MSGSDARPGPSVHDPAPRRARAALAGIAVGSLVVFGLLLTLVEVRWSPLRTVDDSARDGLNAFALSRSWFVTAMKAASAVGSAWGWDFVLVTAVAWLLRSRRTRSAVFVIVTAALSPLLNDAAKALVRRARPVLRHPVDHAAGLSFPSGHSQSAVVGVAVLLFVCWSSWAGRSPTARAAVAGAGVAAVLVIGFSRVALGVHYVSDVLAGYSLGAAWFATMAAAFGEWPRGSVGPGRSAGVTRLPEAGRPH